MQIELLLGDPVYLEMLLLLACHARSRSFTLKEVEDAMSLSKTVAVRMLNSLVAAGLVTLAKNRYTTKEWIYTPSEEAFVPLKDATIRRALEKYIGQKNQDKWQRTVTRLASQEQRASIEAMLEKLSSAIVALPDPPPADAKPYTVGVFSSWRTFGNA